MLFFDWKIHLLLNATFIEKSLNLFINPNFLGLVMNRVLESAARKIASASASGAREKNSERWERWEWVALFKP